MDLVQQVAANLEVDAGKAEKGIGAILMALRMQLDGDTRGFPCESFATPEIRMSLAVQPTRLAFVTGALPEKRG